MQIVFIVCLCRNTYPLEIPVSGLTSPFVCACTKLGPGFLASCVMVLFFMFNELRYKVIVLLILVELMTITV